ncbi:hypothetical protein XPA_000287 [Xanthoria parietina]
MNDQPPPYEEISSSSSSPPAAPVVYGSINADQQMVPMGTRRQPDDASSANGMIMINNTIAGGRPTDMLPSAVNASTDKLLIPFTRPTVLHFPYHARLSQMGITATEWKSFTSAIASVATLSGAQKAKAITAAIGTRVVVNPWLGAVVGMWVWRREVKGLVLAGGKGGGVGMVLGEWNRVWEGRGLRVGLVAPGVEVEGLVVDGREADGEGRGCGRERGGCGQRRRCGQRQECGGCGRRRGCGQSSGCGRRRKCGGCRGCGARRQSAERNGCGKRRRCGEKKRNGCCWKDRGFKLLVERIGDNERGVQGNERVDNLEKGFAGLMVDSVDGRKE